MARTRLCSLVCLIAALLWGSAGLAVEFGPPPAPSESSTRLLEQRKNDLTIRCARQRRAPKTVSLQVRGHKTGRVEVAATSNDPFARCFAQLASKLERGGGTYQAAPKPYRFAVRINLTQPKTIISNGFESFVRRHFTGRALNRRYPCVPRPGAIPISADINVTLNDQGVAVGVKTTPANQRVSACLHALASKNMAYGAGTWNVQLRRRISINPMLTSRSLERFISRYGPRHCSPGKRPPRRVKVTLIARVDAKQFAVKVAAKAGSAFERCLIATFQAKLRAKHTLTLYKRSDGTIVHDYFRITSDAGASVTFSVESKEEVAKRERLERRRRAARCRRQRRRGQRSDCDRRKRPDLR